MSISRYKRVPINWRKLKNCIYEQGYNYRSLASALGISDSVFYHANVDGKMNPFVVLSIGKFVDFDSKAILGDFTIERIYNGRSTSGRISIDWPYLTRCAKEKGYSLQSLSLAIGKSKSYLGSCKREGGISEDILLLVEGVLKVNQFKLLSYDRLLVRKEIINMISETNY